MLLGVAILGKGRVWVVFLNPDISISAISRGNHLLLVFKKLDLNLVQICAELIWNFFGGWVQLVDGFLGWMLLEA